MSYKIPVDTAKILVVDDEPEITEIVRDIYKSFCVARFIFLTGKDRSDDMGRSFKSGGDMFIKKPFSCERLLEIVNIVLMSSGHK